jgi:hypothetical protein
MSSTRSRTPRQPFKLHQTRKLRQQERNLNLVNLPAYNSEDVIIIPKDMLPGLKEKFGWFNTFLDKDLFRNDVDYYDEDGNYLLMKTMFVAPRYEYFKGPTGRNRHINTVNSISREKLFELLPEAIFEGQVPQEFARIVEDVLIAERGSLVPPPQERQRVLISMPTRAHEQRVRQAFAAHNNSDESNNKASLRKHNNSNNNNSKLAKSRLTKRRNTKHGRTRRQHEHAKRNYTVKKSIKNLLKR